MLAALVVMTGHLLHVKATESEYLFWPQIEKIFSSGAFAVVVFFGLSGIALRYQTDKFGINLRWLIARFIRLMPVYWLTFIPPTIGCYLLGVQISYPGYAYVLSILGLQAISNSISIPPVNGPLWSLSVEIYLSASLLFLGRWKKFSGFYIIGFLIIAAIFFTGNPILQGIPVFYLGFLLPSLDLTHFKNFPIRLFFIFIPSIVLIAMPSSLQDQHGRILNFLMTFSLASSILIACLLFESNRKTLISDLSQRSYSLYACHAPIILLTDKVFFAENSHISGLQFIITFFIISFSTELLYRSVEIPSIKLSRKRLIK